MEAAARLAAWLCVLLCSLVIAIHSQTTVKQLSQKVEQLNDLSSRRTVIRLDTAKFNKFVKDAPRNYSMIVMFTALKPQRGCQICKQASDEFQVVASSYFASMPTPISVYFAMVDFDDANEVFMSMKLNTAPVFTHFPAKGKSKKDDNLEIQRYGFDAEVLAKLINERTGSSIKVTRPPNYMMNFMMLASFVMLGGLAYIKRDSLEFLFQRTTWACIVIAFILVMMSGQMWNQIRGAGFAHRDPRTGAVSYIHGSSQVQFVAETYIVMMLHGAIALGMILINEACTTKGLDAGMRKVLASVGLGLVAIFFSLLLSIFRGKYGGYPYRFLF